MEAYTIQTPRPFLGQGSKGEGTAEYLWSDAVNIVLKAGYTYSGTVRIPYKETKTFGEVAVEYLDSNDMVLASSTHMTGVIGDPYHLEPQALTGYTFKVVQGNPTGIFTSELQTIRFIYTADPELPHTGDQSGKRRISVFRFLFSIGFGAISTAYRSKIFF